MIITITKSHGWTESLDKWKIQKDAENIKDTKRCLKTFFKSSGDNYFRKFYDLFLEVGLLRKGTFYSCSRLIQSK